MLNLCIYIYTVTGGQVYCHIYDNLGWIKNDMNEAHTQQYHVWCTTRSTVRVFKSENTT